MRTKFLAAVAAGLVLAGMSLPAVAKMSGGARSTKGKAATMTGTTTHQNKGRTMGTPGAGSSAMGRGTHQTTGGMTGTGMGSSAMGQGTHMTDPPADMPHTGTPPTDMPSMGTGSRHGSKTTTP